MRDSNFDITSFKLALFIAKIHKLVVNSRSTLKIMKIKPLNPSPKAKGHRLGLPNHRRHYFYSNLIF